jgi:hypothetical protein
MMMMIPLRCVQYCLGCNGRIVHGFRWFCDAN